MPGDTVVVEPRYCGTYKASGKRMKVSRVRSARRDQRTMIQG